MACFRAEEDEPLHPSEAVDDEIEFDPSLVPKTVLEWKDALGRQAHVCLSRQLHALLRSFEPQLITPATGPYPHTLIAQVFSQYIASRSEILNDPTRRGICVAENDAIGKIFRVKSFAWCRLHYHLRRHLRLLDVSN